MFCVQTLFCFCVLIIRCLLLQRHFIQEYILRHGQNVEFGNLILGNFLFWREVFAILRDNLSFRWIFKNFDGICDHIPGKCCIFPALYIYSSSIFLPAIFFFSYVCLQRTSVTSTGLSVNAVNSDGFTPLHVAALHGHESMVALLLRRGGNINNRNSHSQQCTPLHLACQYNHSGVRQLGHQGSGMR